MNGKDHENLTTNFDCICCQNFSKKTKFILGFLFILITVGFFFEEEIDYASWFT